MLAGSQDSVNPSLDSATPSRDGAVETQDLSMDISVSQNDGLVEQIAVSADRGLDELGPIKPSFEPDFMLKQDGFYLLLENGGKIVLRRPFE